MTEYFDSSKSLTKFKIEKCVLAKRNKVDTMYTIHNYFVSLKFIEVNLLSNKMYEIKIENKQNLWRPILKIIR